ncbi:MAG: hypothetical protein ACYTHM_21490 [Planctomycetota bacterium]|jgi:hypothetical protein
MRGIARILIGLMIFGFACRVGAEERWRLKFEHEPPKKILIPPHVPPGMDMYFGQREYWYVLYKITNLAKKKIPNGNPLTRKTFDGPSMCLKIWIETDAQRRLVRPFSEAIPPGVEGMEWDAEKKQYPKFDEHGGRATWGSSRSKPLPPFRGAGACLVDGFFPVVHDYIAEKHGYKPKFNPSQRFAKGPNAALPTLADLFDINEALEPGATRIGCAVFCGFPVSEYKLFIDAVNLLSVFSEDRRAEATGEGFKKLRSYQELFPEGTYIKEVKELLSMENISRAGTPKEDPLIQKIQWIFEEIKGASSTFQEKNYKDFTEEISLLTRAAKNIQIFSLEKAVELLETFRKKFPKSDHYPDADLLYTLTKRNLIPRARQEAAEILKKQAPQSLPDEADRIYLSISGLEDPVLKEGNGVFADEPILVVKYHRRGDPSFRNLQPLRLVEEYWIPGKKRFLHKIARTKIGDY